MHKQAYYIKAIGVSRKLFRVMIIAVLVLLMGQTSRAQINTKFNPTAIRILFVLDGSGSMNDPWESSSRFEVSKKLLLNMIDSIQVANPDIEIGVRIFGFQSPRDAHNCKDSKLVIPFGRHKLQDIQATLNTIKPQGWTPIAYSLNRAAEDFPNELGAQNAIVLITDGLETCDGDICAASQLLADKKIAVRPFVIGLGLSQNDKTYFDCVGTYYDAASPERFQQVLKLVVAQAMNSTTCQILLMDSNNEPTESQTTISIYDHHTGNLLYTFVHALNAQNQPDTLWLDPAGRYDLLVHSFPPVELKDVQLQPGIHNKIKIPCPRGTLRLVDDLGSKITSTVQCLVVDPKTHQTVNLQYVNSTQRYIQGNYNIEVLTLPPMVLPNTTIKGLETKEIVVPRPGTLMVITAKQGIGGVYREDDEEMTRVYEFGEIDTKETLQLQPGKYVLITRWNNRKESEYTEVTPFEIGPATITTLRF